MYPAFRSLLFRLDAERAHQLTLSALRVAGSIAPARWTMQVVFAAMLLQLKCSSTLLRDAVPWMLSK